MKRLLLLIVLLGLEASYAQTTCLSFLNKSQTEAPKLKNVLNAVSENTYKGTEKVVYRGDSTLKQLQNEMYSSGLLIQDNRFDALEDKLIIGQVLEHFLGERASSFYGRSRELEESIVQGDVEQNLRAAFPNGVILKPRSDEGSGGLNIVFGYENIAEFISQYSGQNIAEIYFLQEAAPNVSAVGELPEFRLHSLWSNVIKGASLSRWGLLAKPGSIKPVEIFLKSFLDALPEGLVVHHAWSFDIVEVSKNEFRIVDINTSGSHGGNWSGFLQNPYIMSKLVRDLKKDFNWEFPGLIGIQMSTGFGNLEKAKAKIKRMYRKYGIFLRPAK